MIAFQLEFFDKFRAVGAIGIHENNLLAARVLDRGINAVAVDRLAPHVARNAHRVSRIPWTCCRPVARCPPLIPRKQLQDDQNRCQAGQQQIQIGSLFLGGERDGELNVRCVFRHKCSIGSCNSNCGKDSWANCQTA
jgi:hypothetical protein